MRLPVTPPPARVALLAHPSGLHPALWRAHGSREQAGSSAVASATRRPAVAMGPNSAAPMRMKRKEAPHKEARKTNSPNHEDMGAWEVTVTRGAFCAEEGQRGG